MFYPNEEYGSTYQIPFDEFYEKGYRAIIFDIDNTLVPHGAPADKRSMQLCRELKEMGFRICFLSNNGEARVKPFAEAMEAKFICDGGKPLKKGYLQAAEILEAKQEEILFVGDQLLTDVLGANGAGYYSILVAPIQKNEDFWIVMKRLLERIWVFFYRKSRKYKGKRPNRSGYEANIPERYR